MPERRRLVDRHPSLLRGLLAHGLVECDARALVAFAQATGQQEVRIAAFARTLVLRRMRGGHVDIFELLED